MSGAAALAGFAAALWLTIFQLLLVAGVPWGALAWGGAHTGRLPPAKRLASLAAAAIMAVFAALFAQAAGLWSPLSALPGAPFVVGAFLFAVSTLGNLLTRSPAERLHGAPLALVLTLACLGIALG